MDFVQPYKVRHCSTAFVENLSVVSSAQFLINVAVFVSHITLHIAVLDAGAFVVCYIANFLLKLDNLILITVT